MRQGDVAQQSEMESEETHGFQEFSLSDTEKMWIKTFEPAEYVTEMLVTSWQITDKLWSDEASRD
jgi:hypothetical protein